VIPLRLAIVAFIASPTSLQIGAHYGAQGVMSRPHLSLNTGFLFSTCEFTPSR
jgi:hypothetical protein